MEPGLSEAKSGIIPAVAAVSAPLNRAPLVDIRMRRCVSHIELFTPQRRRLIETWRAHATSALQPRDHRLRS
jgi:hypothetical protein